MFHAPEKKLTRYEKLAFLVAGFMLVFLLALSHFHKMGGYGFETDFYWAYAPDAKNILDGKKPEEPGVGPGYTLVLAGFNLLLDDWFLSGKLISMLSTVFCGIFTFKLMGVVFTQRLALFTMILWFVTVLPFSIMAGTDMFFAMVVAIGIYYFFKKREFSPKDLAVSAAIMAYAYLTRHNAVVLPIAVAVILLLFNPHSWTWAHRVKGLALFGVVFLAVMAPWLAVLQFSSGETMRSDSFLIIASHFYGRPGIVGSEDMRLAAQKFDSLKAVIFYDFAYFVKHYLLNLYKHSYKLLLDSLKFPTFLFVGAGLIALLPRLNKKQISFFVFPVLSFLLLCLVHYEPRYYLYIIGFFVLLPAHYLCSESRQSLPKRNSGKLIAKAAAYYVTVVVVLAFSLKEIKATIDSEPRELLEISRFLKEHVRESETIIARKPHIGFLSNLETKYFPEAKSLSELLEFAANEKADYLIYGEIEAKRRPELNFLLEPENLPNQLEPMFVWERPRTIIYKFRI
ncbi:glycosyltransferase family 39 protein [bacterium]|nr:glycosyltransferase family 39 protein [bacterium]